MVRMVAIAFIMIGTLALNNHAFDVPDLAAPTLGVAQTVLADAARAEAAAGTTGTDAPDGGASAASLSANDRSDMWRCWRQARRLDSDPALCTVPAG
jgi:hypothetical protein